MAASALHAADTGHGQMHDLEVEREAILREQRELTAVATLFGERLEPGADPALDEARAAVTTAENTIAQLEAGSDLEAIRARRDAALTARNAKTAALLAGDPNWQRLQTRLRELADQIDAVALSDELDFAAMTRLAGLHKQRDRVQAAIDTTYNQWRHNPAVEPLNQALWQVILDEERPAMKQIPQLRDAAKQLRQARRELDDALPTAGFAAPGAETLREQQATLSARLEQLDQQIETLYTTVLGKGPRWHNELELPRPPKKNGKPRSPGKVSLWLPPGTPRLRGIVLCDHIVIGSKLAESRRIRYTAARNGLAIIRQFDSTFTREDAPERMQDYIERLAELSGHPDLVTAPLLTIGHSTGGIFARNVAYWAPQRVIGVIHIKSGNMHQHLRPERTSLAGVPFLAINGELEQYGPGGGGKHGIRPAYQNQTQWVMIREQLLRRRREDPDNLMSLLYDAGGHHTSWNEDCTRYCARFIHKAAAIRIPPLPEDPSAPIACRQLGAADGWLSDADLKHPQHQPAPYDRYTGDPAEAFWHLDGELATRAVELNGRSLLPDPSRQHPVPADWP
ncbi:MAG: hypothetical protein ACOCZK_07230 [Planctomycetota bacterium]